MQQISELSDFSFGDYRAQHLNDAHRDTMARLLRRPAGRATARAVIALVNRIQGRGKQPPVRAARSAYLNPQQHFVQVTRKRPLDNLPAEDPFLNLADRFGVPVRRQGKHLWVAFATLKPLLDAPNPALRKSFHEAIERLHEGGFHLHGAKRRTSNL